MKSILEIPFKEREPHLKAVLKLLADYQGEPVIKGEHPLHAAVVALEAVSRRNAFRPGSRLASKQSNSLRRPAKTAWYRLLWASRDGEPNTPIEIDLDTTVRGSCGPPNAELAKRWAWNLERLLRDELDYERPGEEFQW